MNLQIKNSYKIWNIKTIKIILDSKNATNVLNRSYASLIIEWWLHNVMYYLTKPLCHIEIFKKLNYRAKHVDLEER
jgi:hypothetical protein